MDRNEFDSLVERLERKNRMLTLGLGGTAIVAALALVIAVWAAIPILWMQYAFHRAFAPARGSTESVPPAPAAYASSNQPQNVPAAPLLSEIGVTAIGKRLLPEDAEAGRYHAVVELTLTGTNNSNRNIRAYEGSLEVDDLLGNLIINLQIVSETPIDARKKQQFEQYFEINQFENNETQFGADSFENLAFKWKPAKIVFADGTSAVASQ